jgi:dUTP pyrophosphatase
MSGVITNNNKTSVHTRPIFENRPIFANQPTFAVLKLCVYSNDPDLKQRYIERVELHNTKSATSKYIDSGFDLLVPEQIKFTDNITSKFIDMGVKSEMIYYDNDMTRSNSAFYMFPRSSISKTNLCLANHTGIIDSGYRGPLIGAFRWFKPEHEDVYYVEPNTRLVQVCHPSLCPIYVVLVDECDLSTTERGEGGFGSTNTVTCKKS